MAREYMTLGPTPAGEKCAQVGKDDYYEQMRIETRAYINQLTRMHPQLLETGVYLRRKGFEHEYGMYHEVCAMYDDHDENQVRAALDFEAGIPEFWDDLAKEELAAVGYKIKVWSD